MKSLNLCCPECQFCLNQKKQAGKYFVFVRKYFPAWIFNHFKNSKINKKPNFKSCLIEVDRMLIS